MKLRKILFKITHWEAWHYHVKYVPIAPAWLWFCIRARSFWFFTASNPTITFGGFEGEGKDEIYKQLPVGSYPDTILVKKDIPFSEVEKYLYKSELKYPLVVKPDEGMMGYMFRRITHIDHLRHYHNTMPLNYLLQEWVDFPLEVSIFYTRMPDTKKGKVSGFLMKNMPEVTGDGRSTLYQLIHRDINLQYQLNEISKHHKSRFSIVLPPGEKFILSYASNRNQGAKLISLANEIDERLVAFMDNISIDTKHFYYGRYDIKCDSIEKLKEGKDFKILEYNGAGAGIQHIYGNGMSLWKACTTILAHWNTLFQISHYNHSVKKVPYWEYKKGSEFLKKARHNLAILKQIDSDFPV